jgi:ankyrin repeat protein
MKMKMKMNRGAGLLQPALHKAAGKGNDGMFEILLNRGADAHLADRLQQTALQEATRREHSITVKMLVDYGAELNARAVNPPSH